MTYPNTRGPAAPPTREALRRELKSGFRRAVGLTALGTVVRSIPQRDERRRPDADSSHRVVRIATREDIVARLNATLVKIIGE